MANLSAGRGPEETQVGMILAYFLGHGWANLMWEVPEYFLQHGWATLMGNGGSIELTDMGKMEMAKVLAMLLEYSVSRGWIKLVGNDSIELTHTGELELPKARG